MIRYAQINKIKWLINKIEKEMGILSINVEPFINRDYDLFKDYFYKGKSKIDRLLKDNQYSSLFIDDIYNDYRKAHSYLIEIYNHYINRVVNTSLRKIDNDIKEIMTNLSNLQQ